MSSQPGQPNAGPQNNDKFNWARFVVMILLIAGFAVLLAWWFGAFNHSSNDTWKSIEFLKNDISSNNIKSALIDDYHNVIKVTTGDSTMVQGHKDVTYYVNISNTLMENMMHHFSGSKEFTSTQNDLDLISRLNNAWHSSVDTSKQVLEFAKYPTVSSGNNSDFWVRLLISLLPAALTIGFFIWMFKKSGQMGGEGGLLSSKSQAQRIESKKRFSDVAGQEEAKEEVMEVVDFLKRPQRYKAAGARIPKGILLGGPPGTGKTLLAKAVAGEAGVPFYFISASNFVEMFAGMGAKRVRDMFKEARKNAPSILFIDELDAVGRKRGSSLSGNDEREQTLNQILVEMDGIVETNGLLIIAATNRPDVLDPAILRPGRFDRTITVNLPDIKEREAILKLHAKGKRMSPEIDFKNIAKRVPGYSGAQLESVVNEATLLSVRENTGVITLAQVDEAIDRVAAGPAKKHRVITPEENKRVAIHEAGHAVVGLKVQNADIVQKITIIPRGDAGGYTLMTPEKELYNYTKSQLEAKIMGYLGGRAAEQVYYGKGEVTTGASDDIQKATNIARVMVTQYGMSQLGPIAYEKALGSQYLGQEISKEYSDALAERIDEAIRGLILDAEKKAIEIIRKHKPTLNLIVEELLEKETIVLEEINYINEKGKRPPKRKVEKKKEEKKSIDDIISKVKNEKVSDEKDDLEDDKKSKN